ncbi:hypothetical protein TTRE_0000145101 [Trichuris trichiura]|uniref:Uncharacterized protein n=1 Tax=Trichuris trichiura TaxID=36087 RepID=A0A077Z0J1_TRITR|nr:hypothetical protein TTRE_0000145101 [Trichuris trichiura]
MERDRAAHGFSALIDEFRAEFHNRMTSLLREFDDFEYEMKRSEEMVQQDKRRKDEYLTEMKRKYPRWTLPVSSGAKEQSGRRSRKNSVGSPGQVVQLTADVDQLKRNYQELTAKFGNLEHSNAAPTKKVDLARPTYDSMTSQLDNGKKQTVESVSSEDDRFLELNFASIAKPQHGFTPLRDNAKEEAKIAETTSSDNSANRPTRFAFDQYRKPDDNTLRPETKHANEATSANVEEQSSIHSGGGGSPDKISEASSSLPKLSSPNLLQAVARQNPTDVKQDDFMAKLFPDKFGAKQKIEASPEDIFALKDDSDSDFFA